MHTKMFRAVIAAMAVIVMAFSPVAAVTDGYEDGYGHPYVGIMVGWMGEDVAWRCSGTLISPTIFLTAGHCTDGADRVEVWFDPYVEYGIPHNGYPTTGEVSGEAFNYPKYDPNAFFLHDLGVVVLDTPVYLDAYGALPELNQLDSLATQRGRQDVTFTAVGYGLQMSFPDQVSFENNSLRIRMVSHPSLVQINTGLTGEGSLILSNNAHTGGTCFGDSGGPNFIGTSNVIGGVTSFGMNGNCAGTGGVYRIDREDDLEWIWYMLANY